MNKFVLQACDHWRKTQLILREIVDAMDFIATGDLQDPLDWPPRAYFDPERLDDDDRDDEDDD